MKIIYCYDWDSDLQEPAFPCSVDEAREYHEKEELYSVMYLREDNDPILGITVRNQTSKGSSAIFVKYWDNNGTHQPLKYQFQTFHNHGTDKVFLFITETSQRFDNYHNYGYLFFFDGEAPVDDQIRKEAIGGCTHSETNEYTPYTPFNFDQEKLWVKFPVFGEYDDFLKFDLPNLTNLPEEIYFPSIPTLKN